MRADTVTSLAAEVKEAVKMPVSFLYMGNYHNNGIDRKPIEKIVDWVNVLCYSGSPEEASQRAQETLDGMDDPSMLICGLNGHKPIDSAEQMRDIIAAIYETGARRFSYYNYGMISPAQSQVDCRGHCCGASARCRCVGRFPQSKIRKLHDE